MQVLLYFIVTLIILIFVHEFGHFWLARRCGVKVLKFSIGFGKPVWKRTDKQGTEYILAAIPLGGYIKMLDEREGDVADKDLDKAFNKKSLKKRVAIVAAGPLANLLFAVLMYWVIFVIGIPGIRPLIGEVEPDSAADIAGFVVGSEIKAINGNATPTWSSVYQSLIKRYQPGDVLDFSLGLSGSDIQRQLTVPSLPQATDLMPTSMLKSLGISPLYVELAPVIHSVTKANAAAKAGILPGDRVLSVDGQAIDSWSELVAIVRASPNKTLQLVVDRANQPLNIVIVPAKTVDNIGQIGARVDSSKTAIPDEWQTQLRYDVFTAALKSIAQTWTLSLLTIKSLVGMATGTVSSKTIGGPISIAQIAHASADRGIVAFMRFLAMISIGLAILNFLPIPILDGGHLALYFIEWVRGKPLSEHAQINAQKVGVVLLLLLISLAFFNDLSRLFGLMH